ncbi:hypothetical protein Daesc_000617 [Daldinia eschscholtzii]|uniref:Uncharacterized protein n=1 Tax=Daldinia eschscholtzii TaxID=292717 RepID=A0AAX6MYV8_9PEZI
MSFQHQAQGITQYSGMPRPVDESLLLPSATRSAMPTKRSDDDIQFISCRPVKKRKISDHAPKPTVQQHSTPAMSIMSMPPVPIQPPKIKDSDRRISTGMVGLPSDFNTMELASMLRGVSLPVLEKFVFNQPPRGPRTPSSPELSPKQLPQTVTPAVLSIDTKENGPRIAGFHMAPIACMAMDGKAAQSEARCTDLPNLTLTVDQLRVPNTSGANTDFSSPISESSPKKSGAKRLAMPPPPVPNTEVLATTKSTRAGSPSSNNTTHSTPRSDTTKQPCQICFRMRQVDLAKSQGFPMFPHNLPHHMLPQIAGHQPLNQHLHPQMIAVSPNGIHSFGPGFTPIMMPINNNNSFATLPNHTTNPTQVKEQVNERNYRPSRENSSNHIQTSAPATVESHSPAALNPVKPPASLIQPTYRKPSPNLIVDVAETCQEKFPFEDVAKRHNVPVERVFDVFAAIIQVPLLRCPTDRRRAGKLATTRVKEYTKVKKMIQEARNQNSSNSADQVVVKPLDIANQLGRVNLPDNFYLGES